MSASLGLTVPLRLFINGEWVEPDSGKSAASINPATGELLAEVPSANETDVGRAVTAARAAYPGWRGLGPRERARRVQALARRLEARAEVFARLDAIDSGNVIRGMRGDVQAAVDALDYFAGLALEIKGETVETGAGRLNYTLRQPYGVVGKINPFNHPFRFGIEKLAAPLIAGNTVVVKPPEQAPLSTLEATAEIAATLPSGVVNVVTGDAVAGAALVRHPDVPRIALIGSVEAGRAVMREAADRLKVLSLELGGKNPLIVFPDVDPERAAEAAVRGMNFGRQGQSCSSTSRIFVHGSLHAAFIERLLGRVRALRIGPPEDERSEVGCVASQEQFDKVMRYVALGQSEGARLLCGGRRPEGRAYARGFFIEPAVFDGVTMAMRIAREEIFGPVLSVLAWTDREEMLAQANAVEYGLSAAILTENLSWAHDTAERLEAGFVWVNSAGHFHGTPYGGWTPSGLGREECLEELLSYTQQKNVNVVYRG